MWVDNVVAIGNSGGFVEPLEATALTVVCSECFNLVEVLSHCAGVPTPTMRRFYNNHTATAWDEIRDFLALHYKVNTRLDTPFWRHARADTDMGEIKEFLEFYEENGPTGLGRYSLLRNGGSFGVEGYLVMLVGNSVPYRARHVAAKEERRLWNRRCAEFSAIAQRSFDVRQALAVVRDPRWVWNASRPVPASAA